MSKELFYFLQIGFDITKAIQLSKKYIPQSMKPKSQWIGSVAVQERLVKKATLGKPVLFGTFVFNGKPSNFLIGQNGYNRTAKALQTDKEVKFIILNLADTLKVIEGCEEIKCEMRQQGSKLGIL